MSEIMEAFPQLDDTAAATIYRAFNQWWTASSESLSSDEQRAAMIGFAAGWINRPASDW